MILSKEEALKRIWDVQGNMPDSYTFDHKGQAITLNLPPGYEYIKCNIYGHDGFYEAPMLDYIAEMYPKQGVILDIGANIGNHARYFETFLEYEQMFCFEPSLSNYQLLCSNINNPKTVCYNLAAGEEHKRVGLRNHDQYNNNSGAFVVTEGEEVLMVTIDEMCFNNVTLMKIDVELTEPQVLRGAMDTIKRCRPILFIEQLSAETFDILQELGYQRHREFYWDTVPTFEYIPM
jgi:FkbM family methyltransferase